MSNDNKLKLHDLMYTLLYPAVLGTMIVGIVFGFTEGRIELEYRLFFSLFLIFYFSSQHVENARSENSYTRSMFILDIFEIIFIFVLFLFLNVYKFSYSVESTYLSAWKWFYGCLVATFLVPVLSRAINNNWREIFKKNKGGDKSILSILAVIITLFGLCVNESILLLILLTGVFLVYLIFIVFGVSLNCCSSGTVKL